jgi:hypothetical protein
MSSNCGICGPSVPAEPPAKKFDQLPNRGDINLVAGDSYVFTVTLVVPPEVRYYPELVFSSHIRSLGRLDRDLPDGYFVPASNSPDILPILDASSPYDVVLNQTDVVDNTSDLYRMTQPEEFEMSFSSEFRAYPVLRAINAYEYPVHRVFLYLSPMMSRFLYLSRDESMWKKEEEVEHEHWHCYHLPPEANVPPTASGYPETSKHDWTTKVGLPMLGGEYDSRTSASLRTGPDSKPYSGLWDVQMATLDGKFVRTILTGSITISGDITRRGGIDA